MIDLTGVTHHQGLEELVDILCIKTQNKDRGFFRTGVAFFFAKMATCMRATIITKDRGNLLANIYAVALAESGYSKGHSMTFLETEILSGFMKRFMSDTLPVISEQNLWGLANERAIQNASDPQDEFDKLQTQYNNFGPYIFGFDEATAPAAKQLRQKLALAKCGSLNLQVDEIGTNLSKVSEILGLYLELYDKGLSKPKLTKHTADNKRTEDFHDTTPANMLLFGTPSRLLDGGKDEDDFFKLLETGYARRCLFSLGQMTDGAAEPLTAEEIYDQLCLTARSPAVVKWATHFHDLADPSIHGWQMDVEAPVGIQLIRYKSACEKAAKELSDFADNVNIRRAEMSHRYFKALKLAGAYAFIDKSAEIEMGHLMSAILLVEESGTAFEKFIHRDKPFVRLGKYLAGIGREVTQSDLHNLHYYHKVTTAGRTEMLTLAISWGYTNNVLIKRRRKDEIEFIKGEALKETDLEKIRVSYSDNWAYDYEPVEAPFDQLHELVQGANLQWANHHFKNGHRANENVVPGFNMLVIDVDGGIPVDTVHELLKDYKFLTYTTKRSTPEANRFRLMFPINYNLELADDEYKELVSDVMAWLPFTAAADMDNASKQRSKSWASCESGTYLYSQGETLLDILPFIPRTSKNDVYKLAIKDLGNLDNLERWFATQMIDGSRNNHMIRYAFILLDGGMDLMGITKRVKEFNAKLKDPLSESELNNSILVTIAKRCQSRAA